MAAFDGVAHRRTRGPVTASAAAPRRLARDRARQQRRCRGPRGRADRRRDRRVGPRARGHGERGRAPGPPDLGARARAPTRSGFARAGATTTPSWPASWRSWRRNRSASCRRARRRSTSPRWPATATAPSPLCSSGASGHSRSGPSPTRCSTGRGSPSWSHCGRGCWRCRSIRRCRICTWSGWWKPPAPCCSEQRASRERVRTGRSPPKSALAVALQQLEVGTLRPQARRTRPLDARRFKPARARAGAG